MARWVGDTRRGRDFERHWRSVGTSTTEWQPKSRETRKEKMSFVQSSFWKIFRYPRPEIGTGEPEKHVLFLFRRSATAVVVLCGGGRGGFGPAVVGARAEAGSSTCSCSTDRARARRATRCALTLGFREIDLWASVDGCCVPLLTTGEEETRASSRGAFCSLAVLWDFYPAGVRSADERRASGSRCTRRWRCIASLWPRFSCS